MTKIGLVKFGKSLKSHFKAKKGNDLSQREDYLLFAKRTLLYPQEIWFNYENYVFVAQYKSDKGEFCIAVIVGKDNKNPQNTGLNVITYYCEDKKEKFHLFRKTYLVYPKEKRAS